MTAGSGVLLRPWSLDDAQAVMDAYQDEAIQRWHRPYVWRRASAALVEALGTGRARYLQDGYA